MVLKSSPATLWRQMSKIALGLLREAVVCACHSGPSGCVRSLAAPAGPKAIAAFLSEPSAPPYASPFRMGACAFLQPQCLLLIQ